MTFGRERELVTTSMNMKVNVSDLCIIMCMCIADERQTCSRTTGRYPD